MLKLFVCLVFNSLHLSKSLDVIELLLLPVLHNRFKLRVIGY